MHSIRQFTTADGVTVRSEQNPHRRHFGDAPSPDARWADRPVLQEWTDCDASWWEWSGKLTNPTGTPRHATGVTVRHYGFQTVELTGGTLPAPMRRKLRTPWFFVSHCGTIIIHEQTTLDAQKRIVTP